MTRLIFAALGFVVAGMAMGLFVYRDSRPRRDDWQSILRTKPPTKPDQGEVDTGVLIAIITGMTMATIIIILAMRGLW